MARTVIVPTTGTVIADSATPGTPSTVVGAAPQWADDSDATYAHLQGLYQTGIGIPGSAAAALENGADLPQTRNLTVDARIRMGAGSGTGKPLPTVSVFRSNGEQLLLGGNDGVSGAGPAWVTVPLAESHADGISTFAFAIATGTETLTLSIGCPTAFEFPPSLATFDWTIYEAELLVHLPSAAATSCRNFPADTFNAPGGPVRQYPPSRSVARSNRFGGGYL